MPWCSQLFVLKRRGLPTNQHPQKQYYPSSTKRGIKTIILKLIMYKNTTFIFELYGQTS